MFILVEDCISDNKSKKSPKNTEAEDKRGRIALEQENIPHKLDIVVHGVCIDNDSQQMRHLTNKISCPENGREIRPGSKNNAPQMHDITEENGKGRQSKSQANAEEH